MRGTTKTPVKIKKNPVRKSIAIVRDQKKKEIFQMKIIDLIMTCCAHMLLKLTVMTLDEKKIYNMKSVILEKV